MEPQRCGRSAAPPRGCFLMQAVLSGLYKTTQMQLSALCTPGGCNILMHSWLTCLYLLSFQILLDVVPTLPEIPLPPIQANYRPLPSIESITCSQTKRKGMLARKGGLKQAAAILCGREWEQPLPGFKSSCWGLVSCLWCPELSAGGCFPMCSSMRKILC